MKHRFARLALAGAALASMVVVTSNTPVSADSFKPLPGPPVVDIVNYTTEIQPANPVTDGTLVTVAATVSTNALLDDLSTVTLCMYKDNGVGDVFETDPMGTFSFDTHSATAPCGDGIPNAANSVEIVWTEQAAGADGSGGFNILGSVGHLGELLATNAHEINGSTACTSIVDDVCVYNEEAQFVTITFKFRVSFALLAGTDWNFKVSAEIPDSACGDTSCSLLGIGLDANSFRGSDTESGVTVLYYGEVRSGSTGSNTDYGYLQDGQTSQYDDYDAFEYLTNGMSQLTLSGTNFVRQAVGGDSLTLVQKSNPGVDEVTLACYDTADFFSSTNEEYVGTTGASVTELNHERNPTIETLADGSITCRLTYGGGADVALATYSNTVTVGIGDARI